MRDVEVLFQGKEKKENIREKVETKFANKEKNMSKKEDSMTTFREMYSSIKRSLVFRSKHLVRQDQGGKSFLLGLSPVNSINVFFSS